MFNKVGLLILLVSMLICCNASAALDWKKTKTTDDGITSYEAKVEGFDFVAFRGIGIVDADMKTVANYVYDETLKIKWMARTAKQKRIKKISPGVTIVYHQTKLPIVDNREFVYKMTMKMVGNKFESIFTDEKGYKEVSDEDAVRGTMIEGGVRIKPVEDGKKCEFEIWLAVDPKGLPAFLVNMIQRSWPIITIRGIRKKAKENTLQMDPDIDKIFSKVKGV
jgi:hypothetical protein